MLSPPLIRFLERFTQDMGMHTGERLGDVRMGRGYALVTDFDGTLAPIVNDPALARPLPAAVRALEVLAGALGLVGVLSGRPVAFLREHFPIAGIELVGQYGMERLAYGGIVVDPRVEPFVRSVAEAATEAETMWPMLLVERKGALSVTIHWRGTPGHQPAPGALEELAARHGLAMFDARMAAELRPPVPLDKGTALEMLLADADRAPDSAGGLGCVVVLGDDRGDLAAFDALDRELDDPSRESPGEMEGLRIAVRSPEAPPELLDRADVVVEGPVAVAEFLTAWAAVVGTPGS